MSLLKSTVTLLKERGAPFALIGATAMAVHGVSRSTRDYDLLVVSPDCLSATFWEPVRAHGVDVKIQKGGYDDPLAGVVRIRAESNPPLDLVVGKNAWQAGVLKRAIEVTIEEISVPVATVPDLILLKLYAGGYQDAWDIEQLLLSKERSAILREVEDRLSALPEECRNLWLRISGHSTE